MNLQPAPVIPDDMRAPLLLFKRLVEIGAFTVWTGLFAYRSLMALDAFQAIFAMVGVIGGAMITGGTVALAIDQWMGRPTTEQLSRDIAAANASAFQKVDRR
jgi:hypothetical protein